MEEDILLKKGSRVLAISLYILSAVLTSLCVWAVIAIPLYGWFNAIVLSPLILALVAIARNNNGLLVRSPFVVKPLR